MSGANPSAVRPHMGRLDKALHHAAFNGDAGEAAQLIAEGASPAAVDSSGSTPLAWAAMRGHLRVAELLLPLSNPDALDFDGQCALEAAAARGQLAIVKLLLSRSEPAPRAAHALALARTHGHGHAADAIAERLARDEAAAIANGCPPANRLREKKGAGL